MVPTVLVRKCQGKRAVIAVSTNEPARTLVGGTSWQQSEGPASSPLPCVIPGPISYLSLADRRWPTSSALTAMVKRVSPVGEPNQNTLPLIGLTSARKFLPQSRTSQIKPPRQLARRAQHSE